MTTVITTGRSTAINRNMLMIGMLKLPLQDKLMVYFCIIVLQEYRIKYNQQHYKRVFNDPESVAMLEDSLSSPSLFRLMEVQYNPVTCLIMLQNGRIPGI